MKKVVFLLVLAFLLVFSNQTRALDGGSPELACLNPDIEFSLRGQSGFLQEHGSRRAWAYFDSASIKKRKDSKFFDIKYNALCGEISCDASKGAYMYVNLYTAKKMAKKGVNGWEGRRARGRLEITRPREGECDNTGYNRLVDFVEIADFKLRKGEYIVMDSCYFRDGPKHPNRKKCGEKHLKVQ